MMEEEGVTWISSKELMTRCGISRATLNNYVSNGLLPRPTVRRPDDLGRTTKIGFFHPSALERLEEIRTLKAQGYSMEQIVSKLRTSESPTEARSEAIPVSNAAAGQESTKPPVIQTQNEESLGLTLDNIERLSIPAYLINYKFEIDWVNSSAEEQVFHRKVRSMQKAEERNVFRLCLNWELSNEVENWESLMEFHMMFLKSRTSADFLGQMYPGMTNAETDLLTKIYDRAQQPSLKLINQHSLALNSRQGKQTSYRIYSTLFREGILFVYVPLDAELYGIDELLARRETVIKDLLRKRLPTLVPFSVLVADLQDSVRICAELPPEEYFELINSIWKTMEESFKRYYGLYGKQVGDGIVYYFLKDRDSSFIMNSISCAMEIKDSMRHISAQWKTRKKWFNDLYLNIGVNEGIEYFSSIHASTSVEFTALGDTINCASRLSDIARCGTIYTTKNLINKLTLEERDRIRFGIRRRVDGTEVQIENVFSRVIDLMDKDDPRYRKFIDIAALPITEIL